MAAILSVSLKKPDGTYTKCIIKIYDTPDKYGNNVAMYVEQTEAEKNANAKKTYLANGKVIWTDGSVCKPTKPLPEAEQVKEVDTIVSTNYNHKPQNNEVFSNFHIAEKTPAQNSLDDIDDLPF